MSVPIPGFRFLSTINPEAQKACMFTMKATLFEDFRSIMVLPPPRFNVL